MARVLVVDDDPALLRALRLALTAAGYEVITATTGEEGLARAVRSSPDVVILDLGLPDIDGLSVCRNLRGWSDTPIIVLSATETEARKVAALDSGADDYVTKPFGMAELEARIRAALRHRQRIANGVPDAEITVGQLAINRAEHSARLGERTLELTSKEFDVLAFLASHAGRVCTHQMILAAVWGNEYSRDARYLHEYIYRLRQKLGTRSGVAIKTSQGVGYVLSEEDRESNAMRSRGPVRSPPGSR